MTPVQLNPVASTALVIFFIVASITLLGLLAAAAYLVWKLNGYVEEYRSRIDPLIVKAETLLALTTDRVNQVSERADLILAQGETAATVIQERVDQTTALAQRTVNRPLIGLNSLVSGVTEGWSMFRALQSQSSVQPKE